MIASTTTHEHLDDYTYLSRIYAHGEIEDKAGYDLTCGDDELFKRIYHFINSDEQTLIRFDKFIFEDETTQSVVMYIWKGETTNYTMGLVVDAADVEAIQYATKKMKARVDSL